MDALATSAALAIRNARLHKDDLDKQLEAMNQVHAAIADKGPDLTFVLQALLQQTLTLTGAKYGACMRWDEHSGRLEAIARWPERQDYPIAPQTMNDGIVGLAARSQRSILVDDVTDKDRTIFVETIGEVNPATIYIHVNPDTRSEIAVPLLDGKRLLGVLNIEHPESRGLNRDHRVLLQTLAVPAIIAFHTVELYKSLERPIRHLSALNLIAAHVQEKPYELDAILRLFLTGITAGSGLGFSRAMLFFVNDGRLRGEHAIGAVARHRAQAVWDNFERMEAAFRSDLDSLLQQMKKNRNGIAEDGEPGELTLTERIRELSFPLEESAGAVVECLAKGTTVLVKYNQDNPSREVLARATEPNDVKYAFAAVPLIGNLSGPIGVLIVDNRFLWQERSIDAEDVEGLEAFARMMALSIDNNRLQQQLTEEQRFANWKEATGGIAHSIGTRLDSILGAVIRLKDCIESEPLFAGFEDARRLVTRLVGNIGNVRETLDGFRHFVAAKQQLCFQRCELNAFITDLFEDEKTFSVDISPSQDTLPILADLRQLENAVMEIVKNSHEAAAGAGREPIVTIAIRSEQMEDTLTEYARLDIRDNGSGIPEENRALIFRPFFTTKYGTGLGLAVAKRVVEKHRGTIELGNNNGGNGAWFIVRIPIHDRK